jgi:integrase/recombinase XerD
VKWKQAILDYNHYLNIERGLSENTIDNYLRDIKKFVMFLEKNGISSSPINITEEFIQEFVYEIAKK